MSVINESNAIEHKRYYILVLPEFLDLIGRIADRKYRKSNGLPLERKIMFVLKELFDLIGFEQHAINDGSGGGPVVESESSCSDDEY